MDDNVERAKRESVGQLLMKAGRLVDERALERVREDPAAPPVRPAHTRLFPHLSMEGVRITDLAARLGVTKQAVQPLVADLQDWGVVEVVPDPSDGRARLVRWTPRGVQAVMHGLGVLRGLEAELAQRLGAERWAALHAALLDVVEALEDQASHRSDRR
jgi:DNA-binding MarR family transcriptional regulator